MDYVEKIIELAKMVNNNVKENNNVTVGDTGYLDKMLSENMSAPFEYGKDEYGRKFISIRVIEHNAIYNEKFDSVCTIHERYEDDKDIVVCAGFELFPSTMTDDDMYLVKELIQKGHCFSSRGDYIELKL